MYVCLRQIDCRNILLHKINKHLSKGDKWDETTSENDFNEHVLECEFEYNVDGCDGIEELDVSSPRLVEL